MKLVILPTAFLLIVGCASGRPTSTSSNPLPAPADAATVVATVERFFASMRTRDTATLRALIGSDVVVVSSRVDASGTTTVRRQQATDMLRSIAASTEELRERMWSPEVRIDGDV